MQGHLGRVDPDRVASQLDDMLDVSQALMPKAHERNCIMRRRRYQKGSLQKRKQGRFQVWSLLWWHDAARRYQTLGRCSDMTQGQARVKADAILGPLNQASQEQQDKASFTLGQFVTSKYLPFCERKWKDSTAMTTKQRSITIWFRSSGHFRYPASGASSFRIFSRKSR